MNDHLADIADDELKQATGGNWLQIAVGAVLGPEAAIVLDQFFNPSKAGDGTPAPTGDWGGDQGGGGNPVDDGVDVVI